MQHLTYDQLMAPVIPFPAREPREINIRLWAALERFAREGQRQLPRLASVSILQKEPAQ